MFRERIAQTALTTDRANAFFSDKIVYISVGHVSTDATLLSTARALICRHLEEGERFAVIEDGETTCDFGISNASDDMLVSGLHAMLDEHPTEREWYRVCYGIPEDEVIKLTEVFEKHIGEFEGWKRIEKMTQFYEESFQCSGFVNEGKKQSVVFVGYYNTTVWHYLQCGLVVMLPWWFGKDKEHSVEPVEMEMIRGLAEKNPSIYLDKITEISKQFDFRSSFISEQLRGIEKAKYVRIKEDLEREISHWNSEINRMSEHISEIVKTIDDKNIKLAGVMLKMNDAEGDHEIENYFLNSRGIELDSVRGDGSQIVFTAFGYCVLNDDSKNELSDDLDNERSVFYMGNFGISNDDRKKFFKYVFIDEILKIRFCAKFALELPGGITALSHEGFGPEFDTYMPNPHIQRYGCIGKYAEILSQLNANSEYLEMLDYTIPSATTWTVSDGAVNEVFVPWLFLDNPNVNNRCIELPDGKVVTPKSAINWIHKHEEEIEDE